MCSGTRVSRIDAVTLRIEFMLTPCHASFDEEGKNKSHALNVIVDESTSASLAHGIRQPYG